MHYHYLTIEQRESLEKLMRSSARGESELKAALEKLRQPDYGICIECGKDIEYVRLQAQPFALHCAACSRLPITTER
ncbi:MAG: TraR/DksA family transcriptional regulator [Burkholderiales bacterium]